MTALAVVCEYNPFHTGHAYQIEESKKRCNPDLVLGIMSGFFVQRAEPAILSPATRAEIAIKNGMDCIIELPTVFSCASGNIFADGAIRILSHIPSVKFLSMGTEDDGEILQEIAEIQNNESEEYKRVIKECLNGGLSYAVAATQATKSVICEKYSDICENVLKKPNNILAIEYLKAIRKYNADITPIFIKRVGNSYNDIADNGEYISASAARLLMQNNKFGKLGRFIPSNSREKLKYEYISHAVNFQILNALTVQALRQSDIGNIADVSEGLDKKLAACAEKYSSLEKIIKEAKSKRYTMSRIKRVCLQTLLGITKDVMKNADEAMGRLIGIKKSFKNFISELNGITIKNNDYILNDKAAEIAEIDGTAGGIYSLITGRDGNSFWSGKLIEV